MMSGKKPAIGFIGCGLMGAPMARRLLQAGYTLQVWNRTPEKLAPLQRAGAVAATSPAGVVGAAALVFTCLTNADAVEAVVFGEGGISSAGASQGKILVDFSSIRPDATRDMAARLAERSGMAWVDCPVSGGVKGAEDGTLVLMAGGAGTEVEAIRPHVAPFSQRLSHVGPLGAGQTVKLCNQIIVACGLVAMAEAVNLAERAGVDAAKLAQTLAGGFADSIALQIFLPRMASRAFEPPVGHLQTMLKDLNAARHTAAAWDGPSPMSDAAIAVYQSLLDQGRGQQDVAALMAYFDKD